MVLFTYCQASSNGRKAPTVVLHSLPVYLAGFRGVSLWTCAFLFASPLPETGRLRLVKTGIVFEAGKEIDRMSNMLTTAFIKEMQAEYSATKKCLERIPADLYAYQPHPKSMNLGYLSLLVAEIPLWISTAITKGEVDFTTFRHFELGTSQALIAHFETNFKGATDALQQTSDEALEGPFVLRNGDTVLMRQTKNECVSSSINHWVHHRGQLTVYMRLNDIPVPSIYGPSADDKTF